MCDHNTLRRDLALQTAVGRAEELACPPTFSCLESAATPENAAALHGVLLETFITGRDDAPEELVLDSRARARPTAPTCGCIAARASR
jgi:hypothetical protein